MFISDIDNGRHKFYYYLATIFITLIVMQVVGTIPLLITVFSKIDNQPFTPELFEQIANSISGDLFVLFTGISFLAAFGAFIFCIRYIHKQPVTSIITYRTKIDFQRIGWGLLIIVLFRIPLFLIELYTYGDSLKWNFEFNSFILLLLICVIFIPIQAGLEEVFFRGYLLKRFNKKLKKKYWSVLITSILFTVLHFSNPEAISFGISMFTFYFLTAVFLALITIFDNGTELAIGVHAGINIFTLLTITSEWSSFNTSALYLNSSRNAFELDIFLLTLVVYPIIFFIFAKKFGWKLSKKS
jgi:membrane protease YdiL (CAAX protease family)